jgi:multiple sugar transport system permease protein
MGTDTLPRPVSTEEPAVVRKPRLRRIVGSQPIGVVFTAPYLIFLALVVAYPLGLAVWISFHDYFFTAPGVPVDRPFVGLANYRDVVGDPATRRAFLNIGIFLIINVPLTVVLSLVLATALNAAIPFRTLFRTAFFLPYVTASVAVLGVWLWLFSSNGLANTLLGPLAPEPSWLVNRSLAMPLIALFVTWKQLGFFVLLYLAALQSVPKELYETAGVDGAGRLRTFLSVTVPGVRPATTLVVILATVTGANLFTEPYLLTGGGGPDGASASPVLIIYQRGIQQGEPDFAAALGVILMILVLGISMINRRLIERE